MIYIFFYFVHTLTPFFPEQACVAHVRARKWRIVGAQVPVADLARRAATAIDLLCVDEHGTYIVLEIKTRVVSLARHTEEYKRVNTQQPRTSYRVPNSLYYRHQVQLAKTTNMFKKCKMARGKTCKAYILVLVENKVVEYPLAVTLETG